MVTELPSTLMLEACATIWLTLLNLSQDTAPFMKLCCTPPKVRKPPLSLKALTHSVKIGAFNLYFYRDYMLLVVLTSTRLVRSERE